MSLIVPSGLICDFCLQPCGRIRFLCLDCSADDQNLKLWDTCDAETMACFTHLPCIDRGDGSKPHNPEHNILKLRMFVGVHDLPDVYWNAWETLAKARRYFDARPSAEDMSSNQQVALIGSQAISSAQSKGAGDEGPLGMPESDKKQPQCGVCQDIAVMPCWYLAQDSVCHSSKPFKRAGSDTTGLVSSFSTSGKQPFSPMP